MSILPLTLLAKVTLVSASGFVSEHKLDLPGVTPDVAYQALTTDIHRWWDAEHSYSGKAENFSLDARAGGCFCERLDDGGSVMHMQVVFARPGAHLRLVGGLGPLQQQAVSGSMEFVLTEGAQGTTLSYRYAVSGMVPGGIEGWAAPVDAVQLGQLKRLQSYLAAQDAAP